MNPSCSRACRTRALAAACLLASLAGCATNARLTIDQGMGPDPALPPPVPEAIPTVHIADAHGWPTGSTPNGPPGTRVTAFATGLDHPRWLHVLPNGDVLVAETSAPPQPEDDKGLRNHVMGALMKLAGSRVPSADRVTLLRDADGDGIAETRFTFIAGLHSPFGMALVGHDFYVADTDAVLRFHYTPGTVQVTGPGEHVVDLPAGPRNHHWTKSLIASPDGRTLYATVGSNSNAAENGLGEETNRAAIWAIDRASGRARPYATGLRNANGMAWVPETGALWAAVNERDEIGGDLVPDYMTAVHEGGFYGWPYSYYGAHVDSRVQPQRPDLVARAIVPDYALGAHTASLGLAYAEHTDLPPPYQHGMFVGQHGSWNRRPRSGYKVIFVPFVDGRPAGAPVDVLTGFVHEDQAYGRPAGVALDATGALLVADDVGNTVWRVACAAGAACPQRGDGH